MTIDEALNRTISLLERQGWVSYQTLRRRFRLDDAALEALRRELVVARQLVREEDQMRLVWLGALQPASGGQRLAARPPTAMSPLGAAEGEPQARTPWAHSLIGRQAEESLLRERWRRAQQGEGQVVLVRGEAGIGKSHLVSSLRAHIADARWVEARCAPAMQHSAFYPVIDLAQQLAGIRPGASASARLQQLETFLDACQLPLLENVPILAALLSIPCETRYPALASTPDHQRQQTLDLVVTMWQRLAAQQPLLLILEDAHWADPSSIDALQRLIDTGAATPMCVVVTCRPEFRLPGAPLSHVTPLTLNRLTPQQIETVIQRVAGADGLTADTIQQIVERADGIPFFAEELTRTVLSAQASVMPATLDASLQARLAQLGSALVVAQTAAVWGRAVTEAQLQAAAPLDPIQLPQALERLVELDIFYEASLPPRVTYVFRHALLQEAAYQSMPDEARRAAHEQVAQALEAQFAATVDTQPELVAHHYTLAACNEQALAYWQRASERTFERSAYLEAISHLRQGLAVLETLEPTPEVIRGDIAMQRMLGAAISAIKGSTTPELATIYRHAQAQCRRIGETELLFPVLQGLWRFHLLRCELDAAREVGRQLLELAEQSQNASELLRAHMAEGLITLHRGDVTRACASLEKGLEGYDLESRRRQIRLYVQEPGAATLSYIGIGLALRGYLDQALQRTRLALDVTRDQRHPQGEALARIFVAWAHQYRCERQAAREHAEAARDIAAAHRLPLWETLARMFIAWANAKDIGHLQAAAELRQTLRRCQEMGVGLTQTHMLTLLAECYLEGGDGEQCLQTVRQAQDVVEASGEAFCAAELHRLQGEALLLQRDGADHAAAAAAFEQALQLARQQQARLWELRAAVSWGRLLRQQGRGGDALALVTPIYQQFNEALETPELTAAQSFLTESPR